MAERHSLGFRAEFFNLLNHANLGLPNRFVFAAGGAVVGNAGAIQTLTTASRQIQFGLRYSFGRRLRRRIDSLGIAEVPFANASVAYGE